MPFHSPAFERLPDLALLGRSETAQQLDVFAAAMSPPPGRLLLSAPDTTGLVADHRYRAALPGASIYALPGHVLGSAGLLMRDSSLFWRSDVLPRYYHDLFAGETTPTSDWMHGMLSPDVETLVVNEPLGVATHPNVIYGHFLLEMLPRLYMLDLLRRMGQNFRLALSTRVPDWVEAFVGLYFQPREMLRYDSARQVVQAPSFVLPSMLNVDYYLHPTMNLVVDDFLARVAANTATPAHRSPGPLIYVSRRLFQAGAHSTMSNGEAVEATVAALGFAIVHPETLSVREQMDMFSQATCIMGEYGSAVHNALFAPRGSTVIVINRLNNLQGRIAALRGQTLGVIEPEGGFRGRENIAPDRTQPFTVNLETLRRFVTAALAARQPMPTALAPSAAGPAPVPIAPVTIAPPGPPAAAVAPPPQPLTRIPFGGYLQQMEASEALPRSMVYGQPERRARGGFIYAEPIDRGLAPFGHLFSASDYLSYDSSGTICAGFDEAAVIGSDGLVVVDGRVIKDTTHGVDWWRSESLVEALDDQGAVRLKRGIYLPLPHDGAYFVGFSGGWRNQLNWMVECLPRLFLFNWLRPQVHDLRLLLPTIAPNSLQARSLEIFGIDPAVVVRVPDDTAFVARRLWCASGIDLWAPSRLVHDAAVAFSARVGADLPEQEARLPSRLYVRTAAGLVTDAADLGPVLARHGFVTAVLDDMTLDQQVRLMRNARLIVGESGATLAGLMFCAARSRILEIFPPAGVQPTFWSLASLCDIGYGYVVGSHVATPQHPEPSALSSCSLDPKQLEAALHWLCAVP